MTPIGVDLTMEGQAMENVPQIPIVEHIIGKYFWALTFGFIVILFKNTLESLIAGVFVFMGNDLNEDDVVYVDGEKGRIVRVSPWKTTFYIYEIDDSGNVIGGRKMVIDNTQLKSMRISTPLSKIDLK
jgi:hypothetical protein